MDEIKLNDNEVALNPILSDYMKLGWTFYREEWQNGHNGDWEVFYHFRSPRMEKPASAQIAQYRGQSGLTEDCLLDAEASILAHRFIDCYEDDLKDGLHALLKKRFRRRQKINADDLKVRFTFTTKS